MVRLLSVLMFLVSLPSLANAESCDPREYLRRRPDVQAAGVNPYDHYVTFGQNEGMCAPNSTYTCSEGQYLNERPDVRNAGMNAVDHYNWYGRFEGMCKATPPPQQYMCSLVSYNGRIIDVAKIQGNPYGRGLNNGEYFYAGGVFYCYNGVFYMTGTNLR